MSPVILSSIETTGNVTATLLDTGNFVLKEESGGRVLWQSFDYPTNTLLPGMKLGINSNTGHTTLLTSWKNSKVPASGSYTLGLDPNGSAQLMIWWQGEIIWRSGEDHFEHVPKLSYQYNHHSFSFVSLQNESYFTYSVKRKYTFPRYRMGFDGLVYESEGVAPFGACVYSSRYVNVEGDLSRAYSSRYINMEGDNVYRTSTEDESGCVDIHGKRPYCRIHDCDYKYNLTRRRGFIYGLGFKYKNSNLSIYDCMELCFKNCSCVAFSYINDDQTGCEIWNEDMEFLAYEEYGKVTRYVYSIDKCNDLWKIEYSSETKLWRWISIGTSLFLFLLVLCFVTFTLGKRFRLGAMTMLVL
ncbi:hypothetical protein QQ045_017214 [Rhodiola kirilowii]